MPTFAPREEHLCSVEWVMEQETGEGLPPFLPWDWVEALPLPVKSISFYKKHATFEKCYFLNFLIKKGKKGQKSKEKPSPA
jgi:hypothetical protein